MKPIAVFLLLFCWILPVRAALQATISLEVLDREGKATGRITDGDRIQIRISGLSPVNQERNAVFYLGNAPVQIGTCAIPGGGTQCTTASFRAYGWYWVDGPNPPGENRAITADLAGQPLETAGVVTVQPRPVVMVHGFISDYQAWLNYLGPQGYLAAHGMRGFAVGDGQVAGLMKTGSIDQPTGTTNTIAQNAAILKTYIDHVKTATGAQTVDLLSHSMGGLISRYYIDRLMPERDIGQLILLGTPSSGSDCAILPAALGFYMPTVLEIRSSYMVGVFNQQIYRRQNVPFFALAGTGITSPVGSPCTGIPSDLVVSVNSVTGISVDHREIPILHTDLNVSAEVFQTFVLPLLQRLPEDPWVEPDPPMPAPETSPIQYTRIFTGHVDPGGSIEQTINLEEGLAVASFGLYDRTHSLAVVVTGASGSVIELSAEQNGLIQVDDPATLVTMGYGFQNPRPGPWKIRLAATERTPDTGADFALTAKLAGGAALSASVDPLLPAVDTPVQIQAGLALPGAALTVTGAGALVRGPDGLSETVPLTINGSAASASWQPETPGLYGLDITLTARLEDGTEIERTAFLSIEAQPGTQNLTQIFTGPRLLLGLFCLGILLLGFVTLSFALRILKKRT